MRDYHTHTYRCKHAEGKIEDYAKSAVIKGVKTLGVTEHTPLPDGLFPSYRMDMGELDGHISDFCDAQSKYPELKMILGMECEYHDQYRSFYEDELKGKWGVKYLVQGQHFFKHRGEWTNLWKTMRGAEELGVYTDQLIVGMASGLFEFVAHPDMFGYFYEPWDDEAKSCSRAILEAAQDLKLPLEINGYGFRKGKVEYKTITRYKYPLKGFWELATQYDIEVLANSDAHRPEDVGDRKRALGIAEELNLKLADLSHLDPS